MSRKPWTLVTVAIVSAGCGMAKTSDQAEKEALERRVAELEERLARSEQPAEVPKASEQPAPQAPIRRDPARVAAPPTTVPRAPETRVADRAAVESPVLSPVRVMPTPSPAPSLVIAEGTTLELVLENPLSSKNSREGDKVVARIEHATAPDGAIALPGGSYLEGRVAATKESGRVKGKAQVDVAFERIVVRGRGYPIETTGLSFTAGESHKRDAAIVAGSAAAGALLGKITGGSAGKGAVLGGAAGGGAVLATKGKEIEVPAGSPGTVRVTRERLIRG